MHVTFSDKKVTVDAHHDDIRESVEHKNEKAGGGNGGGSGVNNSKLRKWLSVDTSGLASTLELSKNRVHNDLGIQLRDLRLLDPMLASSYPSAVLARERALVVNLEFVKMIITLDRVFITNLDDANADMFVEELQRRLKHPAGSTTTLGVTRSTASLGAFLHTPGLPLQSQQTKEAQPQTAPSVSSHVSHTVLDHPGLGPHIFQELSFDLRVLECALDVISGYLDSQAVDLEAAAHPALDALTLKVSTGNLERVRRIKNRMVRLMTKAETLKELLEKLLDDDSDMKDLNLAAKEAEREELAERQSLRRSASLSTSTPFDVPIPVHHRNKPFSDAQQAQAQAEVATPENTGNAPNLGPDTQPIAGTTAGINVNPHMMLPSSPFNSPGVNQNDDTISEDSSSDEDVEVVEQLVEAYLMMVDNTCNKLETLADYIEDTEDFINIELDSHRNQLIRLDLILTAATASIALITAVTSLFAMNVQLIPGLDGNAPYSWFVGISVGTAVVAVTVFVAIMTYCRHKQLI